MTDISSSALVKNYGDIYLNTQNIEHTIEFFEELKILPQIRFCKKCKSPMHKTKDHFRIDNQKWACTSKTACAQIAKIMFCWSHKLPKKFAVAESDA
ncbi:30976_t:CDS:2, partial [Gigaspora margarita]